MAHNPPVLPPLPLSFSHKKPLALSRRSSDKIIPALFHLLLHPPLLIVAVRRDPEIRICNSHFSLCVSQAHTLRMGYRSFQAPWGNYSPLWSPPWPLPHFEWSLCYYPHSVHSGDRCYSCVDQRLTSVLPIVWDTQPISLHKPALLACGSVSTWRCHSVSYVSLQKRQENGGYCYVQKWMFIS